MKKLWQSIASTYSLGNTNKASDRLSELVVDFFIERDPSCYINLSTYLSDKALNISGDFLIDAATIEEAKLVLPYKIRNNLNFIYKNDFDWGRAKKTLDIRQISKRPKSMPITLTGFACDETDEFMPLGISCANKLMRRHDYLYESGKTALNSDANCQIIINNENNVPKSIDKIIYTTSFNNTFNFNKIKEFVIDEIIKNEIPEYLLSDVKIEILSGHLTGFEGVKSYSGNSGVLPYIDYGNGYCSTTMPLTGATSNIYKAGSLMARAIAKGIVKGGNCTKCKVLLSYNEMSNEFVNVFVNFLGTGLDQYSEKDVENAILESINLNLDNMTKDLNLSKGIYEIILKNNVIGVENKDFTWETEIVDKIASLFDI